MTSRRRKRSEPPPAVLGLAEALPDLAVEVAAWAERPPRVLVGAAEPAARDRLRRVLASAGCLVEALNGEAAPSRAEAVAPPDIIVVERALLGRLPEATPADHRAPIILLTGGSGDAARDEARDAGADDYLAPAFGARELLSRVGLHLAMARVGRDAMEAVRASERRLAGVLEAIGEAVYAMDRDEHILFANRKALEFWGMPAEAAIGRPLLEVFPGIENGAPYKAYRQVMRTRRPAHLETTAPALDDRWIGLDVYPAGDGGLVVAFRDIDERKRAEARLRDSEERFRLMLEALPQAAFLIRADGEADYYNQALRDYVGAPIGTSPAARTAMQHPDDRQRLEAARAAGAASGREYTVELRIRRYDGVYRWHRLHNRPIRFDGRIEYWLGTAIDIDDMRETNALLERRVAARTAELEAANRRLAAQIEERERAEARLRQAQRIEAVGQLTSGVAHDFNNLLTAIIGNLELLQARLGGDERNARSLAGAMSAAERGARLTAQLLAFSRQQRMSPEPVDLNNIVHGIGALLQSTIGATVAIETKLAERLSPALADAGQIELVLLNLAINARDAMPSGGAITVSTRNARVGPPHRPEEPPAGSYVMISVADTGSGIPPDILDRVFEPFFTTKEIGKGSGLGLSQVLGVAQQLGGGVRIETRAGEGTTVEVYLPRVRDPAVLRPGAETGRAPLGRRGGERILLVDDDDDVRAVAAAMLASSGYEVVEAASGGGALDRLEQEGAGIDLLIADVAMPGMSGIELARAARLGRADLPVLFVTGFIGNALPEGEEIPGEVLHKPFRTAELAERVAALLGRQSNG